MDSKTLIAGEMAEALKRHRSKPRTCLIVLSVHDGEYHGICFGGYDHDFVLDELKWFLNCDSTLFATIEGCLNDYGTPIGWKDIIIRAAKVRKIDPNTIKWK